MSFDTVVKILETAALVLLVYGLTVSVTGMVLRERRRGYRLPYEQSSHVRVLRGDES
jgi:hypothetical protein